MKSSSLLVLACLFTSVPTFAQSLPDEINYGPFQTRYRSLQGQISSLTSDLSESQSRLAQTKKFISSMSSHITGLERKISDAEVDIATHRRLIPDLSQRISDSRSEEGRLRSEIRSQESLDSSLSSSYQQELNELKPLEAALARNEQRLRDAERELTALERELSRAQDAVGRSKQEMVALERKIQSEQAEQRRMAQDLASFPARTQKLEGLVRSLESSLSSTNSQLSTANSTLSSLVSEALAARRELEKLESSGASKEEIQAARGRLEAASARRDAAAAEVKTLKTQVARLESELSTTRSQLSQLSSEHAALKTRIAQSEQRERQYENELARERSELGRLQADVDVARRNVDSRRSIAASIQSEVRSDEARVSRQQAVVSDLVRRINAVRERISSLGSSLRSVEAQTQTLSSELDSRQAAIPKLEGQIRSQRNEIAEGKTEIAQAQRDVASLEQSIEVLEAKIAQVSRESDGVEAQMTQRLNLYRRFKSEAEALGSSQAEPAKELGSQEGLKISNRISKTNGESGGLELGSAQAKYWGTVRGEIQGYDGGYAEGMASAEDIARAEADAKKKGAEDAYLFATAHFKPAFFEEFVQLEFKKPLRPAAQKNMKGLGFRRALELAPAVAGVEPVTAAEVSRSLEVKTVLDATISKLAQDLKTVETKASRLKDPALAFEAPASVPFGKADCKNIYKGLQVFKDACEASYKEAFGALFEESARETFGGSYPQSYESILEASTLTAREAKYPADLKVAFDVGRAEGLKLGKIEVYRQTYARAHKLAYDTELPLARERTKVEAGLELSTFLTRKPLLTLAASKLEAQDFRGGEEITVLTKVKNVSKVASSSPVLIKITEAKNAELVTGQAVLNSPAAPGALTDMPGLKVRVSQSARTGEKVVIKGTVDLPGDLYRPARQEKFELEQVLSANPASNLNLTYSTAPDIKNFWGKLNTHYFTAAISPKVEGLPSGYSVSLRAIGDNAWMLLQAQTELTTGALEVNQTKELTFSYQVQKAAKGQTITLELAVSYAGKVISKQVLELYPR